MMLKIYMKKLQVYGEQQQPVYYTGQNPHSLIVNNGFIPDNEFIDVTKYIDNLHEFSAKWKVKKSASKGISNLDKAVSTELQLFGKAYDLVKGWLFDHVAAPLNGIDVKVEVVGCGTIEDFVIKSDGISYCNDDYCNLSVNLKQKDDLYTCLYSTLITDNHNGMFDGTYEHPRFEYCNEFRPTSLLTVLFSLISVVGFFVIVIYSVLYGIIWVLVSIINVIISAVNWIPGVNIKKIKLPPNPVEFTEAIAEIMYDLSGCGRVHPAPLIRDYISNVCSKCGISLTDESVPIFFNPESPYYNLTMLSAEVKKGIKDDNRTDYWIKDNDPLLTLDMLLDRLKPLFNANWYIRDNTLFFDRVDRLQGDAFVYDFIGQDKDKILGNVCFTWNEEKKPAFLRIGYTADGMDNLTTDCLRRYNDLVEFNKPVNPLLEGEGNEITPYFAPARFRNDGVYKDYVSQIFEPTEVIRVLLFALPAILTNQVEQKLKGKKYSLLMQNHTTLLPKLIIWDGKSKTYAKAVREYQFNHNMPSPNYFYNKEGLPYEQVNDTNYQYDTYENENNWLINYPMFFDAMFKGNLYDFHEIGDPRISPPMNKSFELNVPLCCGDLTKLGVLQSSGNIMLDQKVKIDGGNFYKEGIIESIEAKFDGRNKFGRHIKITGKL